MNTFVLILTMMIANPVPLEVVYGFNSELGCQLAGSMRAAYYHRTLPVDQDLNVECRLASMANAAAKQDLTPK